MAILAACRCLRSFEFRMSAEAIAPIFKRLAVRFALIAEYYLHALDNLLRWVEDFFYQ